MAELNSDPGSTGDEQSGKTVPVEDFNAEKNARQALDSQVSELTGTVNALTQVVANPPASEPAVKVYSNAEVDGMVGRGELTEKEGTAYKEAQQQKSLSTTIAETVTTTMDARDKGKSVGDEIKRYKTVIPDLNDKKSAAFMKLSKAYTGLTEIGQATDASTELAAARQAFGDIDALERSQTRSLPRETYVETGGAGTGGEGNSSSKDGLPEGLSNDESAYYGDLVHKGIMTNDQVAEEIKFADSRLRAKHRGH